MENTMNLFSQFPTNYEALTRLVVQTEDLIESGERNPLEYAKYLAWMEKAIDALRTSKRVEAAVLKEAEKHNLKSFELFDAKFSIAETGVKYDFTNSDTWNKLNESEVRAKEAKKECETLLKALKAPTMTVTNEGELIELFPPIKTSKTKVTVTLK